MTSTNDNERPNQPAADSAADNERGDEPTPAATPTADLPAPPTPDANAQRDANQPDSIAEATEPAFGVVGVGASAGGLSAFTTLLDGLPEKPGLAFVLVPHLHPEHPSLMAQLLAAHTAMPVEDAHEGVIAVPNRVYVIPAGKYMVIENGALHLIQPPLGPLSAAGQPTAIDTFLHSLAVDMQHRAIGIVLSGTSNHGTAGLREIKDRGGLTLVQTPESAHFPQMPRNAIAAGVADQVLAPEEMAAALRDYAATQLRIGAWSDAVADDPDRELITPVLAILKARTKYDFRGYRKTMLLRRVRRRMGLCQITTLSEYMDKLRTDSDEVEHLFQDMLIGVTSFFRDPTAFEVLGQRVLEDLVQRADSDRPVRVWVAGCASGEEAYSIAMLLIETFTRRQRVVNLQLFATDIDEASLEIARQGVYPKSIKADVSTERLSQFFTVENDDRYRVKKELRESVVFAPHNLIRDAPFSHLDLISCRNLLIYFTPEVQQQVIALFHFALRPDGYLLLGPSESVGPHRDLFQTVSEKWRLFRRTAALRTRAMTFPMTHAPVPVSSTEVGPQSGIGRPRDVGLLAERILLDEYAPAAVLVSERFEILYFYGPAGDYLELPTGRPTLYLMDLLRHGLRNRVRAACHRAARDHATVDLPDARVERNGRLVRVHVRVRSVTMPKQMDGMLLISFSDVDAPSRNGEHASEEAPASTPEELALTQQLELELATTRDELQSSIEELESANEELKASNEEAMSANEELQSANEELETSKEELQSLNEEMNTVNNQLEEKVQELERSNNDISNLLASTDIATVFLDTQMRIQRFTPRTTRLLNLRSGDTGRPLAELSPNFEDDSLLADAEQVLKRLIPLEKEIKANDGAHYLRRIQPYRTHDNRIDGVAVTFVDITQRSESEAAVRASEERYRLLFERSPMCLMEQDWSAVRECLERLCAETASERGDGDGDNDGDSDSEKDNDNANDNDNGNGNDNDNPTGPGDQLAAWVRAHARQATECREQVRISAINRATLSLLGLDDAKPVRASPERFFPLQPASRFQALLEPLLQGHGGVQEVEIHTHSGAPIPVLLHSVPVFGSEQSLRRVLIAVIDITDRKRIERLLAEREQRLSAILNTVVDGIIGVDRQGAISEFNAAGERLFACSADQAIGQPLTRFLKASVAPDGRDRDILRQLIEQGSESPRTRLCEGVRLDGALFPAEVVGAEIDGLGGYVLLVRDITQRRELERQIIETSTREQERIGQEIHDGLGQRLTAVTLLAKTLASKLDKAQRPEAKEALKLARQTEQTLLDSKNITQGLAPVGVSPERLVDALTALAEQTEQSTGVRCTFTGPDEPPVTDPVITAHLYRIAQEAVTNAARHGKPARIDIRLALQEQMARLSVYDDGNWDATPKNGPGGLGLHIMGYRAGILGGKLTVTPQSDGGTLMLCEVPLRPD